MTFFFLSTILCCTTSYTSIVAREITILFFFYTNIFNKKKFILKIFLYYRLLLLFPGRVIRALSRPWKGARVLALLFGISKWNERVAHTRHLRCKKAAALSTLKRKQRNIRWKQKNKISLLRKFERARGGRTTKPIASLAYLHAYWFHQIAFLWLGAACANRLSFFFYNISKTRWPTLFIIIFFYFLIAKLYYFVVEKYFSVPTLCFFIIIFMLHLQGFLYLVKCQDKRVYIRLWARAALSHSGARVMPLFGSSMK